MNKHHGMARGIGCTHAGFGPFIRIAKESSHYPSDEQLVSLAASGGIMDGGSHASGDSTIPAGYTFFGQFVDHDITLDTGSRLDVPAGSQDPEDIENMRTPALDLDCVYGAGPEAAPWLYNPNAAGKLAIGTDENPNDLSRNSYNIAQIGDPRNDENLLVSQMQSLWIRFHNKMLDRVQKDFPDEKEAFEITQEFVRYHYQYIVINDYLRRISDPTIYQWAYERTFQHASLGRAKRRSTGARRRYPRILAPNRCGDFPMPIEFSVAAYRFGHALVRDEYTLNENNRDVELFDEVNSGFKPVAQALNVDWRFLLPVDDSQVPTMTKSIDHVMAHELINLPFLPSDTPTEQRSLAFRNLLRARSFGLPTGQEMALVLKQNRYPNSVTQSAKYLDLTRIDGWKSIPNGEDLVNHTPLFLFILREAGVMGGGNHLGPVGTAILLEVFFGMVTYCNPSFVRPSARYLEYFSGVPDLSYFPGNKGDLELADIARFVQNK